MQFALCLLLGKGNNEDIEQHRLSNAEVMKRYSILINTNVLGILIVFVSIYDGIFKYHHFIL